MTTKQGYTRDELEKFRIIIMRKIVKAQNLLSSLIVSLESTNNESSSLSKISDDSSEILEKETVSRLAQRQRQLIEKLEEAVSRINDGTYGVCLKTGELIPKDRLQVVPHTMYSIKAKIGTHSFGI